MTPHYFKNLIYSISSAFLLLGFPAAFAADGILEINASCAINEGCFAGDSPGYPVTITDAAGGRSFLMTSDLVISSVNTDTIVVSTNDVSIDMAGFSILSSTCASTTINCTPGLTGSGDGIDAQGSVFGLSVSNGQIAGMGRHGINAGIEARIDRVTSRWNGNFGINGSVGTHVTNASVYENGSTGLVLSTAAVVEASSAYANGGGGISTSSGSTISGCTARGNANIGINSGSYSVIRGNAVTDAGDGGAGDDGINAGNGATIVDNTVQNSSGNGVDCANGCNIARNSVYNGDADGIQCDNGCSIRENVSYDNGDGIGADDGIECDAGCIVEANTVRSSTGEGLNLSTATGYAGNILTNNAGGSVSGGVDNGGNLCDAGVCP